MRNFYYKTKTRINSDKGDSLTVSQILWITLAVVVAIGAGSLIYNAVMEKARKTADCIENSNHLFTSENPGVDCE